MFKIPFAGNLENEEVHTTILSTCKYALLPFFSMEEASTLRLLCHEFKTTVAEHPWEDYRTLVNVNRLVSWKTSFPEAKVARCFRGRKDNTKYYVKVGDAWVSPNNINFFM